jgi:hypothetical protein
VSNSRHPGQILVRPKMCIRDILDAEVVAHSPVGNVAPSESGSSSDDRLTPPSVPDENRGISGRQDKCRIELAAAYASCAGGQTCASTARVRSRPSWDVADWRRKSLMKFRCRASLSAMGAKDRDDAAQPHRPKSTTLCWPSLSRPTERTRITTNN